MERTVEGMIYRHTAAVYLLQEDAYTAALRIL